MSKENKEVIIKCPNCSGTGRVAVGEICSVCWGKGTIKAELA